MQVPGCAYNNSVWWSIYNSGESHLVAGQTAFALQRLAAALSLAGPAYANFSNAAAAFGRTQESALRTYGVATGGPWLRRAWLPALPAPGFMGDDAVEITQQSWHVLAGVFDDAFNAALAAVVRTNLSDPSPIGPPNVAVPDPSQPGPGLLDNGGVWQGSLNQPWVWALAGINATDAWEQFLLNSLAAEADTYGDTIWAGIWSSSDSVSSFLASRPGVPLWGSFPVLCSHRHAWPLWALTKLAGINFDGTGLRLTPPALPRALLCGNSPSPASGKDGLLWSLQTPAVSVAAHANGSWSGRYRFTRSAESIGLSAALPLQTSPCGSYRGESRASPLPRNVTVRLTVSMEGAPASAVELVVPASVRVSASTREQSAWASSAPVAGVVCFDAAVPLPQIQRGVGTEATTARVDWELGVI